MKLDIITVVYNKSINDILSLQSCENSKYVSNIIICDNSDIRNKNEQIARKNKKVRYLNLGGNRGLSTAYNCGVNLCSSPYICLLDDDTPLPKDFFDKVTLWCKNNPSVDVFLPIVYSKESLLSPCKSEEAWFSAYERIEDVSGDFSGINSGMIIKKDVFKNYRYDQKFFLDYVDHSFILDMRKAGKKIMIMGDVVLNQQFSREDHNIESEIARYNIFKKDFRYFYSRSKSDRFKAERLLLYRKLELLKKYRDIKALFL